MAFSLHEPSTAARPATSPAGRYGWVVCASSYLAAWGMMKALAPRFEPMNLDWPAK
jgi:hypothetical protein